MVLIFLYLHIFLIFKLYCIYIQFVFLFLLLFYLIFLIIYFFYYIFYIYTLYIIEISFIFFYFFLFNLPYYFPPDLCFSDWYCYFVNVWSFLFSVAVFFNMSLFHPFPFGLATAFKVVAHVLCVWRRKTMVFQKT